MQCVFRTTVLQQSGYKKSKINILQKGSKSVPNICRNVTRLTGQILEFSCDHWNQKCHVVYFSFI